ncbi:MAG: hypothetical protein MK138_08175, partial [Planctomycetes bacterium]|nr:hypothetical protein [Planctomycetota bacterium]
MSPLIAAVVTRVILWNVPTWARVLMYLLFLAALAVCVLGIVRKGRGWRKGRKSGVSIPPAKALG